MQSKSKGKADNSDLQGLLSRTIEGILQLEADGSLVTANPAMARILGYPDTEEMLLSVKEFCRDCCVHPEEWKKLCDALADIDGPSEMKLLLKHKDNRNVWVKGLLYGIKDQVGSLAGYEMFVMDITSQMRMNRISDILISISNAVSTTRNLNDLYRTIHDTLKQVVDAHNFFIAMIDKSRDRLFFPYFQDEADDALEISDISNQDNRTLSLEVIFSGKPLFMTGDDFSRTSLKVVGTVPKVWIGVPLKLKETVIGMMAIQDYSDPRHYTREDVDIMVSVSNQVAVAIERKMNEEALAENEIKYRTILDSIVEGYYEVDLAGNLTFFNDSLLNIMGFTPHELMGTNNRDFMDEVNATKVFKKFNEVYQTGSISKFFDLVLLRKDGEKRYIETSVSLIRNTENKPVGFRGVARDITDRKLAEKEKLRMEKQLQYAQRMESIGTLAGGIAHNFNNLLMAIQGYASIMLTTTEPTSSHHRMLESIQKQVQAGSRLTGQLLGYAREGKYQIKPINLNHLVRETSETFAMTKKEIRVHHQLAKDLNGIIADQGQIEQVLMNLFVNAADAMSQGGNLFIETENIGHQDFGTEEYTPKPGKYVRLTVRDTGIGMDEKTMSHIFEPFFTTKDISKGSGLGLASSYGIIKAHGGYISVESEPGKGAKFDICIPASEKVQMEDVKTSDVTIPGTGTILFVDDDRVILEIGSQLLKRLGYEPVTASGGKEALEIYEEHQSDIRLVILDMIMPDMTGGAVYDRLKTISPNVKVLLSSGYTIDGHAKEIMQRGCNGFIQKPFNLSELSQKISEIL